MSEFYKARADDLTREQLIEIINIQTCLHVEGKELLIMAKSEIDSPRSTNAKLVEKNQKLKQLLLYTDPILGN